MPVLQRLISSRHFAELLLYDQIYGIPDAMQLERMVAAAMGNKDYKKPKPEKKDVAAGFKLLAKKAGR